MFFFSPRPIYASATATAAAAVVIILSIFFASTSAATTLAKDEVEALEEIGKSLGKADWDSSVDPCSNISPWAPGRAENGDLNGVTCNDTVANDAFNHVVSIVLKEQLLNGTLPPALFKLRFLGEIDLTRNYLNGTLPPEWGSMKLKKLSVIANRLTGPIPKEYGNITTLIKLELEANQLSGPIPPDIGNLTAIQQLNLCSNNFTGKLPDTLAKLTTLTDLNIQASGLDGPIPPRLIDSMTSLTDLRISDLNGSAEGEFPFLNNSKRIKTLILRSCNIKGELPNYFEGMELKTAILRSQL